MDLFSVFDSRTQKFAGPFVAATPHDAHRMVVLAAQGKGSSLSVFPQDYTLFHLGSVSDKGVLKPATAKGPKPVGSVADILAANPVNKEVNNGPQA